jgi:hypothetical protein
MGINLVPGVPDQAIAFEIERQMQRQAKFNNAEIAGKMGRPQAEHADQLIAHFLGKLLQLLIG